jgi:hypothetical protein
VIPVGHPISKLRFIAYDLGVEPKKMSHLIERHPQGFHRLNPGKANPRPPSVQDRWGLASLRNSIPAPSYASLRHARDSQVQIAQVVEGHFAGQSTVSSAKVSG